MVDDEASEATGRFHFTRRTYAAIGLVIIIVVSVLVYAFSSLGAASLTGLTIRLVFADRIYGSGTFPNRNITFFIEAQVWSATQSLDVQVTSASLAVDEPGLRLGNATLGTGTIRLDSRLTYNLRFNVNESRSPGVLDYGANTLTLLMNAQASSGLYAQHILLGDGNIWNWTTATGIRA